MSVVHPNSPYSIRPDGSEPFTEVQTNAQGLAISDAMARRGFFSHCRFSCLVAAMAGEARSSCCDGVHLREKRCRQGFAGLNVI